MRFSRIASRHRAGRRVALNQRVEGALGIELERAQLARGAAHRQAVQRDCLRLGGAGVQPQRVEQARRGIDGHHVNRSALQRARSASADAVVVLPTPPGPRQSSSR